ncbi:translation initiation factor IF-2-like [Peromyscus leucopus]|uniref:translation initiation factor IF-2-like n=1 Tax=Peromyscus leucopus TaxID=10041 RepID=UPI001884BC72|nr:translation initiation factor IF-2-like [Peromyscus leucopus]
MAVDDGARPAEPQEPHPRLEPLPERARPPARPSSALCPRPWPVVRGPQRGPRAGSGQRFPGTFSSPGPASSAGRTLPPGTPGGPLAPWLARKPAPPSPWASGGSGEGVHASAPPAPPARLSTAAGAEASGPSSFRGRLCLGSATRPTRCQVASPWSLGQAAWSPPLTRRPFLCLWGVLVGRWSWGVGCGGEGGRRGSWPCPGCALPLSFLASRGGEVPRQAQARRPDPSGGSSTGPDRVDTLLTLLPGGHPLLPESPGRQEGWDRVSESLWAGGQDGPWFPLWNLERQLVGSRFCPHPHPHPHRHPSIHSLQTPPRCEAVGAVTGPGPELSWAILVPPGHPATGPPNAASITEEPRV